VTLSVVLITYNEEANLPRTLASVKPLVDELGGDIIVVDSHSTDRTREIAASFGARVYEEDWKGFAAQKNSAIDMAQADWVLLLDADEEVSQQLADELRQVVAGKALLTEVTPRGYAIPRQNRFLGAWARHGGFWPDRKLRLFRRGAARIPDRAVHETPALIAPGTVGKLRGALIHHAYPTLEIYLEHMRRYAALGGEMLRDRPRLWLWLNEWLNPPLTFFYNYVLRLGFLDGRPGLLLHFHHARYVHWKYAHALRMKASA